MTGVPAGSEFRMKWRALEPEERKEIARLANAGETSTDPDKAALVAGLAEQRSRPIELVAVFLAALVGYVIVANLILEGPEPAVAFGLAVGVVAFLIFQRRRLSAAHAKSLEILKGGA